MPPTHHEIAYAKINIALHVRRRRSDGYHDLESLFAFAEDGDLLSATARSDGIISLTIDGPFGDGLSAGPENLVLRAAQALRDAAGIKNGAAIHLEKRLPVASGIGGGSADAAAALRLLARLWDIKMPMHNIAAMLGADVPACLVSRTLMGTGRGEALDLRDIDGLADMPLLLVNPGIGLSTAPVFAGWDGVDRGPLRADTLSELIQEGRNDLYIPALALVPEIGDVMAHLVAQPGVVVARMSGSGATCFALFDDPTQRDAAAAAMPASWWTLCSRIKR